MSESKTIREQFWDPIAGFGVTFRTMFKKVVTEQYPFEKLPTAPRPRMTVCGAAIPATYRPGRNKTRTIDATRGDGFIGSCSQSSSPP